MKLADHDLVEGIHVLEALCVTQDIDSGGIRLSLAHHISCTVATSATLEKSVEDCGAGETATSPQVEIRNSCSSESVRSLGEDSSFGCVS